MKKSILLLLLCGTLACGNAQPKTPAAAADTAQIEKAAALWLNDLYQMGIEITKDSVKINEECRQIISDAAYRQVVYPQQYTWEGASYLLKNGAFKKAFWYFINLYAADTANRTLVVQSLLPFDQLMQMDKVLTSTFYTYAWLDPSVSMLANGKFQVMHPDVLERRFKQVKELVAYIRYFRQKGAEQKENISGR